MTDSTKTPENELMELNRSFKTTTRTATAETPINSIRYATCPNCHKPAFLPNDASTLNQVKCPECNTVIRLSESDELSQKTRDAGIAVVAGDHVITREENPKKATKIKLTCSCGWTLEANRGEAVFCEYEHLADAFEQFIHGRHRFDSVLPVNIRDLRIGDFVRLKHMHDRCKVTAIESKDKILQVTLGLSQSAWVQRNFIAEAYRPC